MGGLVGAEPGRGNGLIVHLHALDEEVAVARIARTTPQIIDEADFDGLRIGAFRKRDRVGPRVPGSGFHFGFCLLTRRRMAGKARHLHLRDPLPVDVDVEAGLALVLRAASLDDQRVDGATGRGLGFLLDQSRHAPPLGLHPVGTPLQQGGGIAAADGEEVLCFEGVGRQVKDSDHAGIGIEDDLAVCFAGMVSITRLGLRRTDAMKWTSGNSTASCFR